MERKGERKGTGNEKREEKGKQKLYLVLVGWLVVVVVVVKLGL